MDFDNIKLEKGMYNICNKSFTNVLEELDPSEKYKGTSLEGLDAYQRQLKRFGIKVSGPRCDTVEKFFSCSDSSILFPEFIARAVKQGIHSNDVLPYITAAKTTIDGIYYKTITSDLESDSDSESTSSTSDSDQNRRRNANSSIPEGEPLPYVTVNTDQNFINLSKHGRVLSSTYEALRFQNLDVLAVILKKIGADIVNELLEDAISVIEDGIEPEDTVDINYAALLKLWTSIKPYRMNVIITTYDVARQILALPEMRDSNAGLNFQGTGKDITPVGAKLICSDSVTSNTIIGLDKECAIQMIQSGDVKIDYDKVIDRQLEQAAISVTAGFSKIFTNACKSLITRSS